MNTFLAAQSFLLIQEKENEEISCITPTFESLQKEEDISKVLGSHSWLVDKTERYGEDGFLTKIHCINCGLERLFITANIQESAKKAREIRRKTRERSWKRIALITKLAEKEPGKTSSSPEVEQEEEEHILGTFSSLPAQGSASYHVFVTDRRVMGIRLPPGGSPPTTTKDLDKPDGTIDFSIPRGAISGITMRNAGKNRNMFVIQIRGGRALKILLKHSTVKELQKEKELFIDGFERRA